MLDTCSPVNNNVELVMALLISTDLGDGGMTLITWLPMNGGRLLPLCGALMRYSCDRREPNGNGRQSCPADLASQPYNSPVRAVVATKNVWVCGCMGDMVGGLKMLL